MSRGTTRFFLGDEGLPDRAMRTHTMRSQETGSKGDERHTPERTEDHGFEKLYTPAELADLWALSIDTVRRLFEKEPGILVLSIRRLGRRQYRTLRIPLSVAERVYRRLTSR
jgi:hypothetical protein